MNNLATKNNYGLNLFDDFNDFFCDVLGKDMKTNISDDGDTYVVTSEIPGVAKENIKIDLEDNTLTINVNKTAQKENKKNYIVKEISETTYSRSFYLDDADENNVSAKLDNGILTIKVGKVKEVKPMVKKIAIE